MNNIKPIFQPSNRLMKVVVFTSGSGTNLDAICNKEKELINKNKTPYGNIYLVFTNVPDCKAVQVAKKYNKNVISLSSKIFFENLNKNPDDERYRKYYDNAVITLIEQICTPDLIVLAGFRRKLGELFYDKFKNKIINLYPGDINKPYLQKGIPASIQALRNNEKSVRATVYLERYEQRFGIPILLSPEISLNGYTEQDSELINRIIREKAEWIIFPFIINELIANGRLAIDENDNIYIDNKMINNNGIQYDDIVKENSS